MTKGKDLDCPEGLSLLGKRAHKVIMQVLTEHDMLDPGGSKSFYSPKEWKERGEDYGHNSELVVVYDGGNLGYFFTGFVAFDGPTVEAMESAVEKEGLYFEPATCWYGGVYPI